MQHSPAQSKLSTSGVVAAIIVAANIPNIGDRRQTLTCLTLLVGLRSRRPAARSACSSRKVSRRVRSRACKSLAPTNPLVLSVDRHSAPFAAMIPNSVICARIALPIFVRFTEPLCRCPMFFGLESVSRVFPTVMGNHGMSRQDIYECKHPYPNAFDNGLA